MQKEDQSQNKKVKRGLVNYEIGEDELNEVDQEIP